MDGRKWRMRLAGIVMMLAGLLLFGMTGFAKTLDEVAHISFPSNTGLYIGGVENSSGVSEWLAANGMKVVYRDGSSSAMKFDQGRLKDESGNIFDGDLWTRKADGRPGEFIFGEPTAAGMYCYRVTYGATETSVGKEAGVAAVKFESAVARANSQNHRMTGSGTLGNLTVNPAGWICVNFVPQYDGNYAFSTSGIWLNVLTEQGTMAPLVKGEMADLGYRKVTLRRGVTYAAVFSSYGGASKLTVSDDHLHSFGAYSVIKNPTVLAAGTKTRRCTLCGHEESAVVAKLTPTARVNTTKLPLKLKQSTTKLRISKMAAGDYVVSWKAKNPKLVSVKGKSNGTCTIKAAKKLPSKKKKSDKTVITATLASGKKVNVTVTVQTSAVKTTKISIPKKKVTLKRGASMKLAPVISPITSLEKVTFKTSNKKVATVSSKGVIKAKASGKAKITVKSGKKSVVLTVTVPKTRTVSIKNVKPALTLKKGKSTTLKPKRNPSNSEEKITFKSSNKKVATVNSKGKIVAKKKGTAKITVTSGKVKVTCVVKVK